MSPAVSGTVQGRVTTKGKSSSRAAPIDQADMSDSDSDSDGEGGVLLVPNAAGSHEPVSTRQKKLSKFKAVQLKQEKSRAKGIAAQSNPSSTTAETALPELMSRIKVTSFEEDLPVFPSVRRKQRGISESATFAAIANDHASSSSSKLKPASVVTPIAEEGPSAPANTPAFEKKQSWIPYSEVIKMSLAAQAAREDAATAKPAFRSFARVTTKVPTGTGFAAANNAEPKPTVTQASTPAQVKPLFTATAVKKYSPPHLRGDKAVKGISDAEMAAPASKSLGVLSLKSWRKSSPDADTSTSMTSESSSTPAKTVSYATVLSGRAVQLLPHDEAEAQRVARNLSRYRREKGLSEESVFTSMSKVVAAKQGFLRPKPLINNDVPMSESTSVYLKGLPPKTTYKDILEHIHCGQIWTTYIDEPAPPAHPFAAAKIAFFTRAQAECFTDDVKHRGNYSVRGQSVHMCNWDRRAEPEHSDAKETRCLQIRGPADIMGWAFFEREFSEKMDLKITEYFEVFKDGDEGYRTFQINFGGVFSQSRAVAKAISKDFVGVYTYGYVADPCNDGKY